MSLNILMSFTLLNVSECFGCTHGCLVHRSFVVNKMFVTFLGLLMLSCLAGHLRCEGMFEVSLLVCELNRNLFRIGTKKMQNSLAVRVNTGQIVFYIVFYDKRNQNYATDSIYIYKL